MRPRLGSRSARWPSDRLRTQHGLPSRGGRAIHDHRADRRVVGCRAGRGQGGANDSAAKDRPVSGMTEPDLALAIDLDPIHAPVSGIGTVAAALVLQHPLRVLQPEHGMPTRHAGIGDHDVALRVAPDHVRTPCRQATVRALGAHDERWCGAPRKRLLGHAPTVGRFTRRIRCIPAPDDWNVSAYASLTSVQASAKAP